MKKFSIFLVAFCLTIGCIFCDTLFADFDDYLINNREITINYDGTTPNEICDVYFNDSVYVCDKNGRKIFVTSPSGYTSLFDLGDIVPYDITMFDKDNLLISSSSHYLHILNLQSPSPQLTAIIKFIDAEGNSQGVDIVGRKLASSSNGVTYAIWNNTIATVEYSENEYVIKHFLTLKYEEQDLIFTNGAFFVNENNTKMYFSISDKIYTINVQTKELSLMQLPSGVTMHDIKFIKTDNSGTIYVLDNNYLYKIKDNTTNSVPFADEIKDMQLNLISGELCLLTADNKVFRSSITHNFINSYQNETAPIELKDIQPQSTPFTILQAKNDTFLYTYKSLAQSEKALPINSKVILLDDQNEEFYYVYDSACADAEFGYKTGYVLKSAFDIVSSTLPEEFASNPIGKIIVGESKLFVMPSSLSINAETKALYIDKIPYGSKVEIVSAPQSPSDSNGVTFYAVKYQKDSTEIFAYIDARTLINTNSETLPNIDVANAFTRAETVVFQDESLTTEIETIAKGTSVKIISTQNGVSKIEYFIKNQDEIITKTGYVKTSFLNDGSLTFTQILGIALMLVSLITAIVIAIVANKQKKKD